MSQNYLGKPTAIIVSSERTLKNILKQKLAEIECSVRTVEHREEATDLNAFPSFDSGRDVEPTYFIWIMGSLGFDKSNLTESLNAKESLVKNTNILRGSNVRSVFVFPYVETREQFPKTSEMIALLREAGFEKDTLIVGDLCTEDYGDNFPNKASFDDFHREYFPINPEELSDEIIKSLFTLSEKKPKAIISKKFGLREVEKVSRKYNHLFDGGGSPMNYKKRRVKSKVYLNQNSKDLINGLEIAFSKINSTSFEKISQMKDKVKEVKPREENNSKIEKTEKTVSKAKTSTTDLRGKKRLSDYLFSIRSKITLKKPTIKERKSSFNLKLITASIIFVIILVFLSPYILLRLSKTLLSVVDDVSTSGNRGVVTKIKSSGPLLNILRGELSLFSRVGFLGEIYADKEKETILLQEYKEYLNEKSSLYKKSDNLVQNFFEKKVSKDELKDIQLSNTKLSEKGAFLVSELINFSEQSNFKGFFDRTLINGVDSSRKSASLVDKFFSFSEQIFGFDGEKKYLLVFSDSSVARPGGGTLKEVALFTVSEGKIDKIDIYDSSVITEKMRGYIIAPTTLNNFMGGDSWNIEDASWATTYEESSDRVRQFMQNSIASDIDGIVTFNSDFIDHYQEFHAKDFDNSNSLNSDSDNVLKSFITSINLSELSDRSFTEFLSKQTKRKNILIHFFDSDINGKISDLNWNDNYRYGSCGEYCYNDFMKLTDYELSDSPLAEVRKTGSLLISIEGGLIKRKYVLTIVNMSDKQYRTYLRVSVPQQSGFAPVEIGERKEILNIKAEEGRKEAGLYVEVDPGENKRLIYSWEGGLPFDYDNLKNYDLNLLKQPGISELETNAKIVHGGVSGAKINGVRFLTSDEVLLYNSSLLTDQVISLGF